MDRRQWLQRLGLSAGAISLPFVSAGGASGQELPDHDRTNRRPAEGITERNPHCLQLSLNPFRSVLMTTIRLLATFPESRLFQKFPDCVLLAAG